MPFDGNKWKTEKLFPFRKMKETIQEIYPDLQLVPSQIPNDTAKVYHVPGFQGLVPSLPVETKHSHTLTIGRVGFITSMSEHFCSSCNRLRITADGNLKVTSIVCLFSSSC